MSDKVPDAGGDVANVWKEASTWVGLAVVGVCLALAAVAGLWNYMTSTAVPVHQAPASVPSRAHAAILPAWAEAVDIARASARTSLVGGNLPGLSVAVAVGGELVWAEGFGWADVERRVPVTPDTQFPIGTVGHALTAAVAGLLVEQGRLDLDRAVQAYVPAYPDQAWPVTLRQVLGHVGGIPSDGGDESPLLATHCTRPLDAVPHFAAWGLRFEPGTEFRYSRFGGILVGAAIEAVTGEPFMRVMRKRVFEPLGMDATRADGGEASSPDRAVSYFPRFAAEPRYGLDLMREVDYSCYAGASGLLSTPSDLVRFGSAMAGTALLSAETRALLQTPLRLASGAATGYGLGWDPDEVPMAGATALVVGHDGDLVGGMVASLAVLPAHDLIVAVTSNVSYAPTPALAREIAATFVTARRDR